MKDIDWSVFWTAVGSIAATLALLGGLALWIFNSLKKQASKDLDDARNENTRLRQDLEARLQVPTFGLEAIKLTEIAAERRISEIEEKYKSAVESKNQSLADDLSAQIKQIEGLRQQLDSANSEREQLQAKLQASLSPQQPNIAENAVGLRTGEVLVVRLDGKYGAIQAVDQSSDRRGSFIKYAWWYQPNGTAQFLSADTQSGFSEARESYPGPGPILQIGPITLEWSIGSDGFGWVYYKGALSPANSTCALAPTNQTDITKIDGKHLTFYPIRGAT